MVNAVAGELLGKDETERPLEQFLDVLEFGEKWRTQAPASDSLLELFKREVKCLIPSLTASLDRIFLAWDQLSVAGRSGRTSEVDAARNQLQASVQLKLRLAERALTYCEILHVQTGETLAERKDLVRSYEKLQRFKTEVLDRWQSLEDLEEILVENFPLSAERLEKTAANCQPPASWYQEQGKPF